MSRYISDKLRALVAHRAGFRCEYCRLLAEDAFFRFHIDHIVSVKHGGETVEENLAYACQICNFKNNILKQYKKCVQKSFQFLYFITILRYVFLRVK